MSRQRPDEFEVRQSVGPLFDVPARHLAATADPDTSRRAAAAARQALGFWQRFALDCVRSWPGRTAPELAGLMVEMGGKGDVEKVRQQIGRRLNELTNPPGPGHVIGKPHLIERRGTRDGCALWWPAEGSDGS